MKARNILIIKNLEELLQYNQKFDIYMSPFEIIHDLEQQVKYSQKLEDVVTVDYKDDGLAIFELHSFYKEGKSITLTYEFTGFAS